MEKGRASETGGARPLVLVTGSSGLLGTAIRRALRGTFTLVGLDVERHAPDDPDPWLRCDLTDDASVRRALEEARGRFGARVASVVHLAAYYDFSGEPSPLYRALTVEGTRRLLRALREGGGSVEQFLFSSSLLVLAPAREGERLTEASPVQAAWDYPRSKLAAEAVIEEEHGAIPAVVLRLAGVYDEGCHSIPLAQQARRIFERRLESHLFPGDTGHGQSFVHRDDAARCVRAAVEARARLGPHELFLVGEEDVVSYEEVQDLLGRAIHGKDWTTLRIPAPLAKAGAWLREKASGGERFIKPWMIDLADLHLPIATARAQERLAWRARERLRDTLPAIGRRLVADPAAWYAENGLELPDDLEAIEEARRERSGARDA